MRTCPATTLANYDFDFQPSIDRHAVAELSTLRFIEEQRNVILVVPPGVGKTHLAVALGVAAVDAGYRIGDVEATQAACQQFSDSVTISYSLDGQPVNSDILPCQQRPDGLWFIDYRFLSHPLPPGVHTLTVTFTAAGGSVTLQRSVDIVPKG